MTKHSVIFQRRSKSKNGIDTSNSENPVILSRDDYREFLKTAYQEGYKDALEKNKKQDFKKNVRKQIEEGKEEAIRLNAKELEENKQKLKIITGRKDLEMLRCESVFPFSIFPDTLIIDTTKISITKKQLFATEYITTIPLKDLSDVNVQTVYFLASLIVRYMPRSSSAGMNNPVEVRVSNLKRGDAIKGKNILKGVLVARAEDIDIAKLSLDEIQDILHKFGQSEGVI
jgi:hypothetical protein